mgnify:CR=1 FL=1
MTTAPAAGALLQAAVSDLFATMPNGFLLRFNDRFEVVSAQGRGLIVFGRTPGELLGSGIAGRLPPTLVEGITPRLAAALAGEADSFELPAPGDGRLYLAAAPVSRESGAGAESAEDRYPAGDSATDHALRDMPADLHRHRPKLRTRGTLDDETLADLSHEVAHGTRIRMAEEAVEHLFALEFGRLAVATRDIGHQLRL